MNEEEIKIIKAIMEELKLHPFYGYRKVAVALKHMEVTRKQVRRIMKKAGLRAIYPGKRLSIPSKMHKKYPYLLRDKDIWLPNQVWATDITYIKLAGGHVYLAAIIDLFSRKVLSWRLSNTLDTEFCISALEEAIMIYGVPAIFNTDQGCQFTSDAFIDKLENYKITHPWIILALNKVNFEKSHPCNFSKFRCAKIRISMDGKGRALDNVYIERLWRSLKYEEIYLNEYHSMEDLKIALKHYFNFYNTERFHQSLEYATPEEIYYLAFNRECLKTA